MANSLQSKKRACQNYKRRGFNASARSEMRTYLKKVSKAILSGEFNLSNELYRKASSILDRLASKRLIHKNKAARHKSRINNQIKSQFDFIYDKSK